MKKNPRIRRGRKEWKDIIEDQATSGQSAAQYCREHQINGKSFYTWRKHLGKTFDTEPEEFIQVQSAQETSSHIVRIETPGGYRLEVPEGIEGSYVKMLVGVLA